MLFKTTQSLYVVSEITYKKKNPKYTSVVERVKFDCVPDVIETRKY